MIRSRLYPLVAHCRLSSAPQQSGRLSRGQQAKLIVPPFGENEVGAETLVSGAAAWPLSARAQQGVMPVIGFLGAGSPNEVAHLTAAFQQGLKELGFVEGQNVSVEYRWAENQYNRFPALAADLVNHQVAVIAATSNVNAWMAARAATATIPIVLQAGGDPVKLDLAASLSRPGNNVTGVVNVSAELTPKRLELLHELVPGATTIFVLSNRTNPSSEPQLPFRPRYLRAPTR
jgi:putative tryptophan/tyrosine transport system substrate-binding protein